MSEPPFRDLACGQAAAGGEQKRRGRETGNDMRGASRSGVDEDSAAIS